MFKRIIAMLAFAVMATQAASAQIYLDPPDAATRVMIDYDGSTPPIRVVLWFDNNTAQRTTKVDQLVPGSTLPVRTVTNCTAKPYPGVRTLAPMVQDTIYIMSAGTFRITSYTQCPPGASVPVLILQDFTAPAPMLRYRAGDPGSSAVIDVTITTLTGGGPGRGIGRKGKGCGCCCSSMSDPEGHSPILDHASQGGFPVPADYFPQESENWCWAAVAQTLKWQINRERVSQCELVSEYGLGRTEGVCPDEPGELATVLQAVYGVQFNPTDATDLGSVLFPPTASGLAGSTPSAAVLPWRVTWDDGWYSGHAMIIMSTGQDEKGKYVTVFDPLPVNHGDVFIAYIDNLEDGRYRPFLSQTIYKRG